MNTNNHLKPRDTPSRKEAITNYVFTNGAATKSRLNARKANLYSRWIVNKTLDQKVRASHVSDIEIRPEVQRMYEKAREFVEQETGYDLSDVKVATKLNYEKNGTDAAYNCWSDAIQIYGEIDYDVNHDQAEYQEELAMEVLVHELMHSTGRSNLRVANIESRERRHSIAVAAGYSTLDMRHASLDKFCGDTEDATRPGTFFEEAFAEEGATYWREQVLGQKEGFIGFSSDTTPKIPSRYMTLPEDYGFESDSIYRSASSYAAASLYVLSVYTEVDIYELMKEGRDPSRATDALRAIVSTIEGVKKGLYATLRDAEYNEAGFGGAYAAVIDAIGEAIEQKQKQQLGKAAIETDQ